MAEKMLFQIAVERIVDRISKLPKEKSERLTKIVNDFKTVDCGTKYKEEVTLEIFHMLFPEFVHNRRSTDQRFPGE